MVLGYQQKDQTRSSSLNQLLAHGASVRYSRTASAFKIMLFPVLITWALESIIYTIFIVKADRSDWANFCVVITVLLFSNLFAALVLTTTKKRDSPLTVAGGISLIASVFGVAALSAFRVPVSYIALSLCVAVACAGLAFANFRLQNWSHRRVALLQFDGVENIQEKFPVAIPLLKEMSDIGNYDIVLIDTTSNHSSEYLAAISRLYIHGVEIEPWTHYLERATGRANIQTFDLTELVFRSGQIYYSIAKRTLDFISVVLLAPFAIPLAALIWLYIRMLDGGPSLFLQQRRGRVGDSFQMYKFRTMRKGVEGGATQSADERILPGCKILRELRLDELPQLFNILRGDMSWIGPRPVSLEIAEALESSIPQYLNRQVVLPGLTGWAQVTLGYASTLDEEIEKLSADLYYIKHMSFDLDLLILVKTVRTVLWRVGAR